MSSSEDLGENLRECNVGRRELVNVSGTVSKIMHCTVYVRYIAVVAKSPRPPRKLQTSHQRMKGRSLPSLPKSKKRSERSQERRKDKRWRWNP